MKDTVFHVPASCDIVTSICDYEIVTDNSTPHAVYTINITCQTHTNSWTVRRRYSEFREVRDKLLKSEGKSVRNINFPCKTYLKRNVSLGIVEERKNSLEAFLESILRIIRLENNVDLKTFLSVVSTPGNNEQATSQLLKVQSSYEEELQQQLSRLQRENSLLRKQKEIAIKLLYTHL